MNRHGATFMVRFRAAPGRDGIHGLRALLKTAKRRFDLRCVDEREGALGRDPASLHRRNREVSMKLDEILKGYANQQQKFLREQESRRANPAKQTVEESIMNEIMKPPLDGFSGLFDDTVEGEDSATNRLIQGQKVKFSNQATWTIGEGEELPKTRELVAANVTRVTQKWGDGQPIETRILEPGEKFPDVEKLNANTPQSEWREGPDGKLHGPWQNSYVVYLLDMNNAERFTYVASTIGAGIATRDLIDRTRWMRSFRGANVYPVVTLSNTFMNTRFGGRQRPHFIVKRWVALGGEGAVPPTEPPALTGPQTVAPPKEATSDNANKKPDLKEVKPVTLNEELNDAIGF
jgi:hypothetical protein